MEKLTVIGNRGGQSVLGIVTYRPWNGQYILDVHPDVYTALREMEIDGHWIVELLRIADDARFTVPVFRTIAQLRARTRVTREPRRLYHDEETEVSHFSRRDSHESRLHRLAVGAPLPMAQRSGLRSSRVERSGSESVRSATSRDHGTFARSQDAQTLGH